MAIELPKKIIDAIKEAPKGVVPNGIRAAVKSVTNGKEYVSESPDRNRLGNTYKKVGPVSVLKKSATPASRKAAIASRKAKARK